MDVGNILWAWVLVGSSIGWRRRLNSGEWWIRAFWPYWLIFLGNDPLNHVCALLCEATNDVCHQW